MTEATPVKQKQASKFQPKRAVKPDKKSPVVPKQSVSAEKEGPKEEEVKNKVSQEESKIEKQPSEKAPSAKNQEKTPSKHSSKRSQQKQEEPKPEYVSKQKTPQRQRSTLDYRDRPGLSSLKRNVGFDQKTIERMTKIAKLGLAYETTQAATTAADQQTLSPGASPRKEAQEVLSPGLPGLSQISLYEKMGARGERTWREGNCHERNNKMALTTRHMSTVPQRQPQLVNSATSRKQQYKNLTPLKRPQLLLANVDDQKQHKKSKGSFLERQQLPVTQQFNETALSGGNDSKRLLTMGDTQSGGVEDVQLLLETRNSAFLESNVSLGATQQAFQPAPVRNKVLPNINERVLDTTIYSPKQHKQLRTIIKRQMREGDSGFNRSLQAGSPSRYRGSKIRMHANSTLNGSKMPQILTSPRGSKFEETSGSMLSPMQSRDEMATTYGGAMPHNVIKQHTGFNTYDQMKRENGESQSTLFQAPSFPKENQQFSPNHIKASNLTPIKAYPHQSTFKTRTVQKSSKVSFFEGETDGDTSPKIVNNQFQALIGRQSSIQSDTVFIQSRDGTVEAEGEDSVEDRVDSISEMSLGDQNNASTQILTVGQILKDQRTTFQAVKKADRRKKNSSTLSRTVQAQQNAPKRVPRDPLKTVFTDKMPDTVSLKRMLKDKIFQRKNQLLSHMSNNSLEMEGMLTVNGVADKYDKQRAETIDDVKQYTTNFSTVADFAQLDGEKNKNELPAMFHFAQAIRHKTQKNLIKVAFAQGIKDRIEEAKETRVLKEENPDIDMSKALPKKEKESKLESLFQRASANESNTVQHKAEQLQKRMQYYEKFKSRDMDENNNEDPNLKYFKKCLEQNSLLMPIFEKIYKKTLCLQDYILSDGQCEGIAEACQFVDHRLFNRILLNNCGLTGNKFSVILEGLAKIKDFKSIIYKHNELTAGAIEYLRPLLYKRIPFQLLELQIIDCKIHCTTLELLLDTMMERNEIRNFTLVNVHHSEASFDKLCQYVQGSNRLRELNVSWQCLRPVTFRQLLMVIKNNRTLVNLTLAWNQLCEDQPKELTQKQLARGIKEVPLSSRNKEVLNCLAQFIKYNTYLVHLDVGNCGLIQPAIKYLCSFLTKSQALQCLHLDGNQGISKELINWITARIKGVPKEETVIIPPMNKEFNYNNEIDHMPVKKGLIRLLRSQTSIKKTSTHAKQQLWKDIREGLKLRNIVKSKRINEQDKVYCGTELQRVIIQRHLGFKELMPMSGKWVVNSDEFSECWYCSQQILTLFLWTPRISELAQVRDPDVLYYYKDAVDLLTDTDPHFQPIKVGETPHIIGPFTNWKYKPMQPIIPYCRTYDKAPPDFQDMAIQQGLVRLACAPGPETIPMTQKEVEAVEMVTKKYYDENWHKIIMKHLRFLNPNIANAEELSKESILNNPEQQVYFSVQWVKPGRNSYVIEQNKTLKPDIGGGMRDPMVDILSMLDGGSDSKNLKQYNQTNDSNFYVHQMLTGFRTDIVPSYANPRHVRRVKIERFESKVIFDETHLDSTDVNFQAAFNDFQAISFQGMDVPDEERNKIKTMIQQQMNLIKELYIHLQGLSGTYPFLDHYTIREHFLKKADLPMSQFDKASYNTNLERCDYSSRSIEGIPGNQMCRATFIEFLIRTAHHIYCAITHPKELEGTDKDQYQRFTLGRAFKHFLNGKVRQYFLNENIQRHSFREEHLIDHQIDMVYSLNEKAIQAVYKKYVSLNSANRALSNCMTRSDCVKMVRDDMRLDISRRVIQDAYAMSKTIVINEGDPQAQLDYDKLTYTEFLEFIARLSQKWFIETEMDEIPMYRKIEYFLELMLVLVGAKLKQQQVVIQEFSDSDDDY